MNKQVLYKILTVVFAIAGLAWILGSFRSYHPILYPFIGLINLAIAYFCHITGKTA